MQIATLHRGCLEAAQQLNRDDDPGLIRTAVGSSENCWAIRNPAHPGLGPTELRKMVTPG